MKFMFWVQMALIHQALDIWYWNESWHLDHDEVNNRKTGMSVYHIRKQLLEAM